MKQNFLLAFSFINLICSCNGTDSFSHVPQLIHFNKQDSLIIGDTSFYYSCFSHYQIGQENFLYCYDHDSNTIHKYLFPQGELLTRIEIPTQFGSIKDFYIINENCIILQLQKKLSYYLINKEGHQIDSVKINLKKFMPLPCVSNINPVLLFRNSLFMTGYSGGVYKDEKKGDRTILVSYNLNNGDYLFYGDYPDIYYKYNFGGLNYRKVYNTINYDERSIIFSFPASHEVFIFDIENRIFSVKNIKSPNKPKINPFSKNRDWYGYLAKQDYIEYYYSNPSYSEIYYDKYRHFYYRFIELPNRNFNYHKHRTYYKKKVIVIYDTSFNILGQSNISDKIHTHTAIITQKGVYFKSSEKSISNKWYLYSLEKIQSTSG